MAWTLSSGKRCPAIPMASVEGLVRIQILKPCKKTAHTNVQTQMDPLCIVTLRPGKQLETDRTPTSTMHHDWDLIGKKTNSGKHSFWFSPLLVNLADTVLEKNHPCSWPQQCILFWCFGPGCQALTAPPLGWHHCKGHFDQTAERVAYGKSQFFKFSLIDFTNWLNIKMMLLY